MDALDLLKLEHQQIMRLLTQVQAAVEQGRGGARVNPVLFRRAAEFLRVFVEGAHHSKEHALYKELVSHGLPAKSGLIRQLEEEHAIGHEHTVALKTLAEDVVAGRATQDALFDAAEAYVRLHLSHSAMEDQQLLPLAQRLLNTAAQDRLRSMFARIEAKFGSLVEAADALEVAFGQPSTLRLVEPRRGGE